MCKSLDGLYGLALRLFKPGIEKITSELLQLILERYA